MRHWPLLLLVALGAAGPASAATYTVAPSGSDSNDGILAPFKTFQKATGLLRDGDTIILRAGNYTSGAYITRKNITIRGEGSVILDGGSATRDDGLSFSQTSGITVEGITLRNCRRKGLFVTLTNGLTVRNCTFSGNASDGLLTGNTSNVLVEGCTSTNNGYHGIYFSQSGDNLIARNNHLIGNQSSGIQINAIQEGATSDPNSDGLSKNCTLEGNTITGCGSRGGAAFNLMGLQNSLVANNLIYNNLAGGITAWDDGAGSSYGSKNNRFYHNTILFQSGKGRYGVQIGSGCTGNELKNNIIACGSGPALETSAAVRSNYNCLSGGSIANGGSLASWRNSTGNDLNSLEGVPALTADHHPTSSSAARDAGSQVLETDKNGNLRPQGPNPDLGCYEETYGGGGGGNPLTAPTGLIASGGDARVSLSWSSVSGASGYHVYRSASQNGTYSKRTSSAVSATSYADTGLTNGTTYWYRVTTTNSSTESSPSTSVSATPTAATVQTYTISGKVTLSGAGLAGVLVAGGGQSALTAADGTYTLSQIIAGTYTITASKSGYTLSAAQSVTVAPSRTGVNFTATSNPPTGSSVIYDDQLRSAWTSKRGRASVTLTATNPVAQGQKSISFQVTGIDGYVELSGTGLSVAGKSSVKFSIHGGAKGGQQLRVRSIVDGVKQESSLNLTQYGGSPVANGWKEYTIPLADLAATSGSLTGIKFFAGKKQNKAYIDYIRVE